MKRNFITLVFVLGSMLVSIPVSIACSGGGNQFPPTLDTILENDILVRAIVIENSGGNSILRVERYLQGGGREYLFVNHQSPDLYKNKSIRGYDYGCSYSKYPIASVGWRGYFSLTRETNGTHSVNKYPATYGVSIIDNEVGHYVRYVEYDGDMTDGSPLVYEKFIYFEVSESEFEAKIAERVGHNGHLPDGLPEFAEPYPRFRELIIKTENGTQYLLPVDSNDLVLIPEPTSTCEHNCDIISSDGGHFAYPIPNQQDRYIIWYSSMSRTYGTWNETWTTVVQNQIPPQINAQKLLFSPNGDYILAWYGNSLSLYAFNIVKRYSDHGKLPTLSLIWKSPLVTNATFTMDAITGHGNWSSNSNAFVYLDAHGLQWVELTTLADPRTIIPNDVLIENMTNKLSSLLVELSTTGRYLRYGEAHQWVLFDILSGQVYDNALVSPDEKSMIRLIPQALIDSDKLSSDACHAPISICTSIQPIQDGQAVREVHWQSNKTLLTLACDADNHCSLSARYIERNYAHNFQRRDELSITIDFAYDDVYGQFAWAFDDYYLYIDPNSYMSVRGYSDTLDSPIASIEWGEPLWYLNK